MSRLYSPGQVVPGPALARRAFRLPVLLGTALLGLALPLCAATPAQAQRQLHQLRSWQAALAALPADERARIEQAAVQVTAMAPEQQQLLRARFASLDGLHRDGWRLGPRVGRHWPALHPLLGFMGEEERQPMLQLLWSLDEADLRRLGRLAGRTPPEARQALRRELLAVPAGQRPDWLRQHAGT